MPAIIAGRPIEDYAHTGEQVPADSGITTCATCNQLIALSPSAQEWLATHNPALTVCSHCAVAICLLEAGNLEMTMTPNCAAQLALHPELKDILSELLALVTGGPA